MDSTIYFEVFILIDILLGDVFCDDVIRHIAGTAAEVASRPQVSSPKLFLQVRKLGQQVVCRAAFKNFTEPVKALAEFRRVLRPGGKALLIDMRRDASIAEIRQYVKGLGVSRLNRLFMMFVFRNMLIKRAYPLQEIHRMAREAGWPDPRIDPSPMGFEAWMTK